MYKRYDEKPTIKIVVVCNVPSIDAVSVVLRVFSFSLLPFFNNKCTTFRPPLAKTEIKCKTPSALICDRLAKAVSCLQRTMKR